MKKICLTILLCIFSVSISYAEEVQFISDNSQAIEQATLDQYKKVLLKKSIAERKQKIKENILKYMKESQNQEVHDFSYRYTKKSIQQRALSCEISVTSDILSRHTGKQISEDYLLEKIEKSGYNQPPKNVNGKRIWGNPNIGFVGNIDTLKDGTKASQWNMTGYGVLEAPIARLYEQFGLQTKIITEKSHRPSYDKNNHLTTLIEHLEAGDSIQLWGDYCTTPKYEDSETKNYCASLDKNRKIDWYYKDMYGNLVYHEGLAGEHAFFLLGYVGSKYNPKQVIVWDSNTGKHRYDKKEWMRKWKRMQYRSIIIYNNEQ